MDRIVKPVQFEAEVVSCSFISKEYLHLVLDIPAEYESIPGQFYNIKTGGDPDPTWRRPFSIFNQEGCRLEFYIRIIGRGTGWLAERKPGEKLDILGPLGKGFDLPDESSKCVLIAGGVGVAPLHYLSRALKEQGRMLHVLWGGGDNAAVELGAASSIGWDRCDLATLDGSVGHQGFVTDLLQEQLNDSAAPKIVYSCGPEPMLRRVIDICKDAGVPVQVSFESRMACGWGVCLGCPILVFTENGDTVYKRVCRDGPIFWGHELAE